jgi:hypothetical protein
MVINKRNPASDLVGLVVGLGGPPVPLVAGQTMHRTSGVRGQDNGAGTRPETQAVATEERHQRWWNHGEIWGKT